MSLEKAQRKQKPDNSSAKAPETLFQLFWLMIKSFVLNIPKTIAKQLIKMAVIFIIVLLIHAYLVVVKNEGFTPTGTNKYLSITAFKATYSSAILFWTFAGFLLSTLISRIGKDGALTFLKEVGSSPAWLVKNFRMTGVAGVYRLLIITAFTILASLLIRNQYTIILYALIAFFSFTSRTKGFFIYIFKLASSDWQRIFNRKGPKVKPNLGMLSLQVFGIFLGFLLAYFIPYKPYGHIAVAVLTIAGAIMLLMKKVTPKVATGILIVIGANVILSKVGHVFADDGGWVESGATLGNWIRSPGALPAVGMGLPPGIGGAIGGLLGGLAGIGLPPLPIDGFELSGNALGNNMGGDGFNGGETSESDGYNGNGSEVGSNAEAGEGQSADAGSDENASGQAGAGADGDAEDGETAGESDNAEGTDENGESGDGSGKDGDGTEEGNDGEDGESRFPEGTTSVENPDGSVTHTLPDGTIQTDHPDGSKSGKFPDGTTATETADGVYTETSPDGTVTTKYPDGTIVQKDPDGLTKTLTPDGIQHNSNGTIVTTNPDGSQTVTETDGTSVTLHPDGKFTTVDEKGISSTYGSEGSLESRTLPDGTTGNFDEYGNCTGGTLGDGTPVIANPDGTLSINNDSINIVIDPDTGFITGRGTSADGSTVVFNGDGTANLKTPDGLEVVVDKDGKVVDLVNGKVTLDDGRVVDFDSEAGTKTVTAPNGDKATIDADGNVKFEGYDGLKINSDGKDATVTYPDGTTAKVSDSGNAHVVGAEGQTIEKGPDGTTYTNPDGSSVHVSSDGNTLTGSDGYVATSNPDGSCDATYPDGTKVHSNADGTDGTITKPNGTVWKGNPDGSQTIEKADGTLLTVDKDQNAVMKYPDGRIETYEPGDNLDHLKKIFGS